MVRKYQTIIKSEYVGGIAKTYLETELGLFIGLAFLNEEDAVYESERIGYRISEARAYLKYCKAEIKAERIVLDALVELCNSIPAHEDKARERCEKSIKEHKTNILYYQSYAKDLNKEITDTIENHIKIIDKYSLGKKK